MPRPGGEWWFNDGAATLVTDASSNNAHGTFGTGQTWVTTDIGSAVNFAGNGIINAGDNDLLLGTRATFVLCMTPNLAGTSTIAGVLNKRDAFNSNAAYSLGFNYYGGSNEFGCDIGTGTGGAGYAAYTCSSNGWMTGGTVTRHVVATYDAGRAAGGRIRFYVNGVQVTATVKDEGAPTIINTSANIRFGQVNSTGSYYYTGILHYALVFPDALDGDVPALQGPWPIWQPTYYSFASAATSALPAIMAHYRRLRSA